MTDSATIHSDLDQAQKATRAAASKLRAAQKVYQAARKAENELQTKVAVSDHAERYQLADSPERMQRGKSLREKLATIADKHKLTYPDNKRWYHAFHAKGGWDVSVQIDHNMVLMPPNGESIEDFVSRYNEDYDYDDYLYEYDLSDSAKSDWVWEPHDGKKPWARLTATIYYRPTGLGDGVDLEATADHAIDLDVAKLPPTAEQILKAFDGAWASMLTAPLVSLHDGR